VPEEFLCARCARHQRTCCQDSEIHVTLADVRRITPHAEGAEFTEFRPPADPVYDQRIEDPFWHAHVFRPDGTRRILKRKPDGDCHFLGSQGCRLPGDVRPIVCRLYPFDYNENGILARLASGCPTELLTEGQQLLQVLGMASGVARELHAQLYREICETDGSRDASNVANGSRSATLGTEF